MESEARSGRSGTRSGRAGSAAAERVTLPRHGARPWRSGRWFRGWAAAAAAVTGWLPPQHDGSGRPARGRMAASLGIPPAVAEQGTAAAGASPSEGARHARSIARRANPSPVPQAPGARQRRFAHPLAWAPSAIPPLPGSYAASTDPAPAARGGDGSSDRPQPLSGGTPQIGHWPRATPETSGVGLGAVSDGLRWEVASGRDRAGGPATWDERAEATR